MTDASSKSPPPAFSIEEAGDRLIAKGALDIRSLGNAEQLLLHSPAKRKGRALDLERAREPRHAGRAALARASRQGRRVDRRPPRAQGAARLVAGLELKPLPQPDCPAMARTRRRARQGRATKLAGHARHHHVRRPRGQRARPCASASARIAAAVDFAPGRRNRHRCAADRRAAGGDDQRRHRLPGRRAAAPLRRRGPDHRSGRRFGAARNGRADHGNPRRRPLGLRIHRGNRRHEVARGNRRAEGDGPRSDGDAGRAADHRPRSSRCRCSRSTPT